MAGETLKVVAGNATGSSIPLENELVIGRSTPGLGSLGGDSEISRVHARVYNDPSGQLMVEDLGSTNGTFVNGNRVSGAQPLRSGDQLRVGQTTMTVEGGVGGAEGATTVGNIVPAPVPGPPPAAAQPPPTQQLPPTQPLPPAQPPAPAYQQQSPGFAGGPVSGPPGRATGGSKAPWYALAAVVLIALIVGGLAIGGVFGGDDKKKDTASNSAATTTTTPTTPTETTPEPPPETTPAAPPEDAMPEPPPEEPSGTDYPPGFVKTLIDQCASNGKLSRSQCKCVFTKLSNAYTFPELIRVLKQADKGNIPPKAQSIIQGCAS
jgi:hypothetical protein